MNHIKLNSNKNLLLGKNDDPRNIININYEVLADENARDRWYLSAEAVRLLPLSTYEKHIKKLDRIREERRNQLQYDHSRTTQMQLIKEGKSKTFANRFNEHNLQINQSNIKLLVKLEKAKPFTRYTSFSAYERPRDNSQSFLKPVTKRKIIETEKENSRIFFKMKSVSSSLSKDRMLDDYAKAQKIKSRITKYAVENNKIALK